MSMKTKKNMDYGSIKGLYFDWLLSLVTSPFDETPIRDRVYLMKQMFNKTFEWSVPYDDNRVVDALQLRGMYDYIYGDGEASLLPDPVNCDRHS